MSKHYLIPRQLSDTFPALQRVAWHLEDSFFGGCFWLARCCSPEFSARVAKYLFAAIGPLSAKGATVRSNLAVAFPGQGPAQIRKMTKELFGYLGIAVVELVQLGRLWEEREQCIEFVAEEGAASLLDAGNAIVFVTAHVGAWQLCNLIAPHYGVPITTVYAPETNPFLNARLLRLRQAFQCQLTPRDGSMRVLMRELGAGHAIGLAVDTRLDSGDLLPFFGVDAPTNSAPARLALRYNCELVPLHVERLPGMRYRVMLCNPISADDEAASVDDKALQMTADLNLLFESWIRATPTEWMCLKRRWPRAAYEKF
ncbi:MAG: lysophospholipid acyltransferase family protein [Pseudomonadales bacterium]